VFFKSTEVVKSASEGDGPRPPAALCGVAGSLIAHRRPRSDLAVGAGPPTDWAINERPECYIVGDATGQALGYFYYDDEPHRRSVNRVRRIKVLTNTN
jgi:hypothetical protein